MSTRAYARRAVAGLLCTGALLNVAGWCLAFAFQGTRAHGLFVRAFEFGVYCLAAGGFGGALLSVTRRTWSPILKWSVGMLLGVAAGVALGALAAYWPWVVVYKFLPKEVWSVP